MTFPSLRAAMALVSLVAFTATAAGIGAPAASRGADDRR